MQTVEQVHVIYKSHLDIGFTNLAQHVVTDYMTFFLPKAIETAQRLRDYGRPERLIWTTGSWLIYEYLEHAGSQERRRMEEAIRQGDIVWHALPFTCISELLDPSLFRHGLRLSQALDRRFGKKTIAAKLTDVPGHTRGIIPLLAEAGVEFLHIGINEAVTMPSVPPLFTWQDPAGTSIMVMYHQNYGGMMVTPDGKTALAIEMTLDNLGPPAIQTIVPRYQQLREQFPNAQVAASTLDQFATLLLPCKADLPIVTGEIGDTWIHGVGSDPRKISSYRALSRLRRSWLQEGLVTVDDPAFDAFSQQLLLVAEHTWGLDTIMCLADRHSYSVADMHTARVAGAFTPFEASWDEQRGYIRAALAALDGSPLQRQAEEQLNAIAPQTEPRWEHIPNQRKQTMTLETAHFNVGWDARTGAIIQLTDKDSGREWAAPSAPLALFRYSVYGIQDYQNYLTSYVIPSFQHEWWTPFAFGKPGMELALSCMWIPEEAISMLQSTNEAEIMCIRIRLPEECRHEFGAPHEVELTFTFPHSESAIFIDVQWHQKPACRTAEALWLAFEPLVTSDGSWRLDKLGQSIDPATTVAGSNIWLHAVDTGVRYQDAVHTLAIDILDAPLVALGGPHLLRTDAGPPMAHQGIHSNLFNNMWSTNFPLWTDEDARFRYVLRPDATQRP